MAKSPFTDERRFLFNSMQQPRLRFPLSVIDISNKIG
jgi:hypothetical protein